MQRSASWNARLCRFSIASDEAAVGRCSLRTRPSDWPARLWCTDVSRSRESLGMLHEKPQIDEWLLRISNGWLREALLGEAGAMTRNHVLLCVILIASLGVSFGLISWRMTTDCGVGASKEDMLALSIRFENLAARVKKLEQVSRESEQVNRVLTQTQERRVQVSSRNPVPKSWVPRVFNGQRYYDIPLAGQEVRSVRSPNSRQKAEQKQ
jgi:hypothetical protein